MKKGLLKMGIMLSMGLGLLYVGCTEKSDLDDAFIEDYVDKALFDLESQGNLGKFGCFEFVFPITIEFADASTSEVESHDELKTAIQTWRTDNPDSKVRPSFGYPLDLLSEDGTLITVESKADLRSLRSECRRSFFDRHGHKGHGKRGDCCYKLVYPLSLAYPDGTQEEYATKLEMKSAMRAWKAANPELEERPTLVYPVTVSMEDETTVEINSADELQALKESCKE